MTNIVIRGADIITLDDAGTVLYGGDVAICDGWIVAVGQAPAGFVADEEVYAHGKVVMPGLFNAHMHSGTVLHRGRGGLDDPDPWFNLRVTQDGQLGSPPTSDMTTDDAYWAALLAAAELIRGGVVGVGDQYFFMDAVARAVVESGLRANLSWCTFGSEGGEIGGDIAEVAAFVRNWQGAGDGRVLTSLGPHSAYLCPPEFLARTAAVAERLGVGIHLRVAESQEQVDFSLLAYDMTPLELLDKNGVLDVPVLAANAVYLNEFDMAILAARRACVVACPSAQRAAGLAPTPIKALQAAGLTVGLGTDGAGLVGSLDMFDAMRDAATSLRAGMTARIEALGLATWGGAQALGFAKSGRLAPEYAADLIVIDTSRPHLWPVTDPLALALTAARPGDITDLMVAGRWLLRGGELTTIDEERVRFETAARAKRLNRGARR